MELGNLLFGNSRGNYEITRHGGWEDVFSELEYVCGGDCFGGYGVHYDNDVFTMRPYYWGDCDCGYEESSESFWKGKKHKDDCFSTLSRAISDKYNYGSKEHKKAYDALLKQFNIPFEGSGFYCSCGMDKIWEEEIRGIPELHGHKDTCSIVLPNFLYKPTGFSIDWYKYYFRDAYMSECIDLDEFKVIIKHCIESVTKGENHG